MKISYKKLWVMLIEREIPKAVFRKETELSPGTMSKLNKNEEVALSVLLRICEYLNCDIGDICEAIPYGQVSHALCILYIVKKDYGGSFNG